MRYSLGCPYIAEASGQCSVDGFRVASPDHAYARGAVSVPANLPCPPPANSAAVWKSCWAMKEGPLAGIRAGG